MNRENEFETVHGSSRNSALLNGIASSLRAAGIRGTFYIGYPVMASSESSLTVDALLVSKNPGLVVFHIADLGQNYREAQDRLYSAPDLFGREIGLTFVEVWRCALSRLGRPGAFVI